ncbi:MAG: TraM recognition domain-containing protein, partial [Patescibacteria group bacterium]|nr:TraM recognition domain-containing protein [Patescibacteria group bacterium]
YLAAMSRADVPDRVMKILPNFYLFVDEFQNFANASFADILSEARKYKLNLTIAHQYIEQMDEVVRPAVFGNVGTMISFRVGATDAEVLEKEFAPVFTMEDLVNLGFAQVYLKLMIDGLSSSPFSATTLPPIVHPDTSYVKDIVGSSREQFARPRARVEEEIVKFHEAVIRPVRQAAPVMPTSPTSPTSLTPPTSPTSLTPPKTGGHADIQPKPAHDDPAHRLPPLPKAAKPTETHKPFSNLKDMTAKPISLSSLAPKPPARDSKPPATSEPQPRPQPKIDAKMPTEKNLNDLKSALSAVLSKNAQPKPASADRPPHAGTSPAMPQPPRSTAPLQAPTPAALPDNKPQTAVEVPEDVLSDVLKVD